MDAARLEPSGPEIHGLVPRETSNLGEPYGRQEKGQGRQVLTGEVPVISPDSRRLPLPCFDDRFAESKWS